MNILLIASSLTTNITNNFDTVTHVLTHLVPASINGTTILPNYDIIVLVQTNGISEAGATNLTKTIKERRKPVIVGNIYTSVSGSGLSVQHGLGMLQLANTITETNNERTAYMSNPSDLMISHNFVKAQTYNYYSTATYSTHCSGFLGTNYNILAKKTSNSGGALIVHFPKHIATNEIGETYGFDVLFMGCLSENTALTAQFILWFKAYLLSFQNTVYVQGYIKDVQGNPLQRDVCIYSIKYKNLLDKTQSSPTDGSFRFNLSEDTLLENVFTVAFPLEGTSESPQLSYNITPSRIVE